MSHTKILILADGIVGLNICKWLVDNYRHDIGLVVVREQNEIKRCVDIAGIRSLVFENEDTLLSVVRTLGESFTLGFLCWWPFIISNRLIKIPSHGFINTHPSLLPFNRGKHYNFWAIVEQAPFGVSLHFVEEGIDSGDIVSQLEIPYDWEDTGGSLYQKATAAMVELFKSTYPRLRSGEIVRRPQNLSLGSFHRANELEEASRIDLDAHYSARDLLNLLRARTFPGRPACWFEESNGEVFEVRVDIRRKTRE